MARKIIPIITANRMPALAKCKKPVKENISLVKEVGEIFKDRTLLQCSVNVKPRGWSKEFCEILPKNYTYLDFNGNRLADSVLEIDWLETAQKGCGDGTRKIREIIDYARKNTDGRLIVAAAQYGEHDNPLLFYYRNGLRSNDERINNILKQVNLGLRPKSDLPKNAFMYLPKA